MFGRIYKPEMDIWPCVDWNGWVRKTKDGEGGGGSNIYDGEERHRGERKNASCRV